MRRKHWDKRALKQKLLEIAIGRGKLPTDLFCRDIRKAGLYYAVRKHFGNITGMKAYFQNKFINATHIRKALINKAMFGSLISAVDWEDLLAHCKLYANKLTEQEICNLADKHRIMSNNRHDLLCQGVLKYLILLCKARMKMDGLRNKVVLKMLSCLRTKGALPNVKMKGITKGAFQYYYRTIKENAYVIIAVEMIILDDPMISILEKLECLEWLDDLKTKYTKRISNDDPIPFLAERLFYRTLFNLWRAHP